METNNQSLQPNLVPEQPTPGNVWLDKKHIVTYTIVLVGLIVVGGAVYSYSKFSKKSNSNIQGTNEGSLSLYQDPKYSFEFQYPSAYKLNASHNIDTETMYTREFDDVATGTDFRVSVGRNTFGVSDVDTLMHNWKSQGLLGQTSTSKITITGFSAAHMDYSTGNSDSPLGNLAGVEIDWYKDNQLYQIVLRGKKPLPEIALVTIDKIIKTFKFTK